MILDLHVHSRYSHDSLSRPSDIVKRAARVGLDAIAVTDHDSIRGAVEAREASKGKRVQVIVGSEVTTNRGDIIGLFLTGDVKSHDALEVVAEIHAQGGLAMLPHPYRSAKLTDDVTRAVDLIEAHNSRESEENDSKAVALAQTLGKPSVGCSDAHLLCEIGLGRTVIAGDDIREGLLSGKADVSVERSFFSNELVTQAIGIVRRRKMLKGASLLGWTAVRKLR